MIERLDVKRALYARIEGCASRARSSRPTPRPCRSRELTEGLPESFARDFLITHFFNPPRYMRLLEMVAGPATRAEAVAAIARLRRPPARQERGPLQGHARLHRQPDRPYWLQAAIAEAIELGLPVEEADAVLGRPIGIPKTGIFGLLDLVGIDLLPHVAASLRAALPADDPIRRGDREPPLIERHDRRRATPAARARAASTA